MHTCFVKEKIQCPHFLTIALKKKVVKIIGGGINCKRTNLWFLCRFDFTLTVATSQLITASRENSLSPVLDIFKILMRFSTSASLVWTFPPCYVSSWETAPLCCLWPFCGRRSALQGCHITPSSLCCLSFPSFTISLSLSPASPLPLCMCRVSCVLQPCHYWAAGITPLPMSCLSALALPLATFSLSF